MRRIFILALLSVFVGAMGPLAKTIEGSKSNPYQIKDSIVVTATRRPTPIREIGSSVTVIGKKEISQSRLAYVSEILRTVPGLDVVQSGGKGGQVSVFIRGANSHHALVMVDGIKMNDPSSPNSGYDFSGLEIENVERIEILRGPQSLLYGSDAISGVIHIFTKKGGSSKGRSFRLKSVGGSQGTFRQSLFLSGRDGKLDYSIMALKGVTDGISSASDKFSGIERDGLTNTNLSANLSYNFNKNLDVNFTSGYSERHSDLDQSFGYLDDPNYTLSQIEKYLAIRVNDRTAGEIWNHSAGISLTRLDRDGEDKFDPDHPFDASKTTFNGWRLKLDWQHNIKLDKRNIVTTGFEVERNRFDQKLTFTSEYGVYESSVPEVSKRTVAFYSLYQSNLFDRLFTTIGMRHDNHEQFGSVTTYRVTGAFLFEKPNLKLKMSYGTAFKAPSLSQLYDPTWGNSKLMPEESKAWDAGFELNSLGGAMSFGITYFHSDYTDLIVSNPDPNIISPINLAKALSKGVEAEFKINISPIVIRGEYTYTEASDENSGDRLIRRPAHKGSLSAQYIFGKSADIMLKARSVGDRYDINFLNSERVILPEFTVVDLSAAVTVTNDLKFTGSFVNILNRNYVEVYSYGVIPRSGYLGVEITL